MDTPHNKLAIAHISVGIIMSISLLTIVIMRYEFADAVAFYEEEMQHFLVANSVIFIVYMVCFACLLTRLPNHETWSHKIYSVELVYVAGVVSAVGILASALLVYDFIDKELSYQLPDPLLPSTQPSATSPTEYKPVSWGTIIEMTIWPIVGLVAYMCMTIPFKKESRTTVRAFVVTFYIYLLFSSFLPFLFVWTVTSYRTMSLAEQRKSLCGAYTTCPANLQ
jgi:hypothetical protein